MRFSFLNIPVTIQPTFWLLVLLFSFSAQSTPWQMVILALVLSFSLLFHEYGHALAAQKFGRSPEITLEGFGGYAAYDGRGLSDKHKLIITLSGPVFTGLLIAFSYYFLKNHFFQIGAVNYFLYFMMKLNIYWLIVNISPLQPLDGGKIAEYFLKRFLGAERGGRFSLMLGNITAALGGTYFLSQGSYMFAYLFLFHGWRNYQLYASQSPQKANPHNLYHEAAQALQRGEVEKARVLFKQLSQSKDEYIKTRALEGLAEILNREGKSKEAYGMLLSLDPENLKAGKWLLCKLAYQAENYKLVEIHSREIYESHPTFETAMLNAKTFSQLKDPLYSVGWLKTALQFEEGKRAPLATLLSDPAFDPIREEPEFGAAFQESVVKRDPPYLVENPSNRDDDS